MNYLQSLNSEIFYTFSNYAENFAKQRNFANVMKMTRERDREKEEEMEIPRETE